jgi:allantoicase
VNGTGDAWFTLVPRTKLSPDAPHDLKIPLGPDGKRETITHLKITIYPDGGVARIRAFGQWKKP